jgi:C-terminal processing protease CtpA/Prc
MDNNTGKVFGEVLYVKPGTNAEAQGIKRGDAFLAVDGTEITINNYSSILQKSSMRITFADHLYEGGIIIFSNERDIVIAKARYAENPVFLDTVYEIHGKKIGYLIYNFFASDKGDESKTYDRQLNSVFGKFKSAGVDNVIVDLRYNSGGSTASATCLASMLASPLNTNSVFYILKYNDRYANKNTSVNFASKIENENINNIGDNLQKLCFITSQWSASASEMVIAGLKPFMNDKIIITGDATVGKSYASTSFYEENNPKNRWGMQPLVAKYTNGNGEAVPATGFIPDHLLKEHYIIPKKQLGDINEELLNAALTEITGQPVSQKTQRQLLPAVNLIDASVGRKAYSNHTIVKNIKVD